MDINKLITEAHLEHTSKGLNYKDLREKYNVNRGFFEYHFNKRGLPFYGKAAINHTYFENIDSEEKAYLLGFFAADGCVNNDGRLSLCITEEDDWILEVYKKELNSPLPIKTVLNTKGAKSRKPQSSFRFNSLKIVEDLAKHGIKPNKTNREFLPPNITDELFFHWLRGFFDGDGHVRLRKTTKQGREASIISNTLLVLEGIKTRLDAFNINSTIEYGKWFRILWYGDDAKKIGELMYGNATYFFERKKERFDLY